MTVNKQMSILRPICANCQQAAKVQYCSNMVGVRKQEVRSWFDRIMKTERGPMMSVIGRKGVWLRTFWIEDGENMRHAGGAVMPQFFEAADGQE